MGCPFRLKGNGCSIDPAISHEVHAALNEAGVVIARWRMVAEEIPNNDLGAFFPPGVYTEGDKVSP